MPTSPTEIVLGSETLDFPLSALEEPFGELNDVLPGDTKGIVRISLFIDEDGKVRWSNLDFIDFDPLMGIKILDAFSNTKFSKPSKNGKPVRVLIKIEVRID